eukprot:14262027-Alexandrium_andersonii.AAC.1
MLANSEPDGRPLRRSIVLGTVSLFGGTSLPWASFGQRALRECMDVPTGVAFAVPGAAPPGFDK